MLAKLSIYFTVLCCHTGQYVFLAGIFTFSKNHKKNIFFQIVTQGSWLYKCIQLKFKKMSIF